MDWRSIRFDWNRARAFLVTAEEGSLSAAARALDMTQPTLGRQVTLLEQELGIALFERGARGLELTPNGLALVEYVRAMGDAASDLSLMASGQSQSLQGNICISATEVAAAYVLPSIIQRLRQMQPDIYIELIASNSVSDLKRREADIALRAFRPTQPDLIAKKLRDVAVYLYAARSYLDSLGNPMSPDDLSKADFIGFDHTDILMRAFSELGLKLTPRNFPVIAENHIVQWELVKQGVGIGVMPQEIGDAEPLVERALPTLEPLASDLWLVTHRELKTNRRVRMVFDYLASELSLKGL